LAQPAVPDARRTQPPAPQPVAAQSVTPKILSDADVAIYRKAMTAAREGQITRARAMLKDVQDETLVPYAEGLFFINVSRKYRSVGDMVAWLRDNRDLAIADRVYRLAVSASTRTVRRRGKRVVAAVVTNIPTPTSVGLRSGGYEDAELPEPSPDGTVARGAMPGIIAAIKDGQPARAETLLTQLRNSGNCSAIDIAILTHRIAASYRAEGRDADTYRLAITITDPNVPQLLWDSGFAAYRMGNWKEAAQHLEALAENRAAQNGLRAQGAFWAARAHMHSGDPVKVVTLLEFAAKQNPSFYGIIAERTLGIDTQTGFSDPALSEADFTDLMRAGGARRAVALWQVGEKEFVGPELNRAFVNNDERLDPAMAAVARALGVPNVELRASEKSAARGIYLTGLFPVPGYAPTGGYKIDSSLVLAFARIESRFQIVATSPVGARGIMQLMPATAKKLGVKDPDDLYDPATSLAVGQRYIELLLNQLDGNLMEIGGAYNAGPTAVSRWRTGAAKTDPLLYVESIPYVDTRSYVKKLMLYHWLYRRRFGQDAASLDATIRGEWPIYRPTINNAPPTRQSSIAIDPVRFDSRSSQ